LIGRCLTDLLRGTVLLRAQGFDPRQQLSMVRVKLHDAVYPLDSTTLVVGGPDRVELVTEQP